MTFVESMRDDDVCISEELLALLHNATEESVIALVARFRASDRAHLALHCYRKIHLRPVGLAIGSTCNLNILVQELGPGLGRAIFDQSRDRMKDEKRGPGRGRPAITLASSAGGIFPRPVETDENSEFEPGALLAAR
jgi:hypothetical protein